MKKQNKNPTKAPQNLDLEGNADVQNQCDIHD